MSVKQAELTRLWGLSRGRVSQMVKQGMPLSSAEEAAAWRAAHYGATSKNVGNVGNFKNCSTALKQKPVTAEDLKRDDFMGTLARLRKNEMVAWGMLASAVNNNNEMEILTREKHYKEAVSLRVTQEAKVDEILLKRKELVTIEEVKGLFNRHLAAVKMSLKTLHTKISNSCNPNDPELASEVIEEAVQKIFKQLNEWK